MRRGRRAPMKRPRAFFLGAAAALLAAAAASAQPASRKPSEWLGGGGLLIGIPLGEFGDATNEGFGVVGHAVFTPRGGPFGVRLQTGGLVYGSRKFTTPVPGTGGLITEDLTTDNWLLNAGIGPQVMLRSGNVRPYAYALAGVGYFATDTSLGSGDDYYGSASTTNYDDTTFAWSAGVGLLFPVSRSVAIDVGVQYVGNGTVRYLVEGDLRPSPGNAPPEFVPRMTEANLLTLTIGVTFGR
jgi:opacity protein-like surface antigen